MSFLPPAPPRWGSPGAIQPQTDKDWLDLTKFFNNLCGFLRSITSANQIPEGGATSGSLTGAQPFSGPSINLVILYCDALLGAATYTFPQAFQFTPVVLETTGLATSLVSAISATAVTVTGTSSTGFLVIMGF